MKIAGVRFPEPILAALRDGRLVVFAGAGVSMGEPAKLPDFKRLAELIASGTGELLQDQEPEDRFLGKLQHKRVDVHNRAAQAFLRDDLAPTELHRDLLRLYSDVGKVRVVTTNFDLLFERAAKDVFDIVPEVFRAPALPLGRNFNGIVHVHGAVNCAQEMVLTDADFGRAYLTEGWARRFLIDLFHSFTILFVGYNHNETIVSYLARALPESEAGQRFALTGADDLQRWRVLGIEPIGYLKSSEHDYSALFVAIRRLAETVSRSILGWKREVTELAGKPPPLGEEEADTIDYALKDISTTRFFASTARAPEWISWLDKRRHLDALFSEGKLCERDEALAMWLAKFFAVRYADDLILLIAAHNMRVHSYFWWALGREIANMQMGPLEEKILSRWVSLLLATMPAGANNFVLHWLGERCIKQGAEASLLRIFDAMAASRLLIKKSFLWPGDSDGPNLRTEVGFQLIGDHYSLTELWQKGLKPNLAQLAEHLLGQVVRRLEEQHFTLRAWQKAGRKWDPISWGRSAIEPHEQDRYPEAVDVLIDVIRDCLEWLAHNRAHIAARWCEQLAGSEAPLLRRLAVHALVFRTDLKADDKLDWLLTQIDMSESTLRHEIFVAIKHAYPEATPKPRSALISAILAYQWPDEGHPEKEQLSARYHFDWVHWLHSIDPNCALAKQALDNILSCYPGFKPREHPDLTHWASSGWKGPQTPWTVEELLSKPPAEWLAALLTFQPSDFFGPDREGLSLEISKATKKNPKWGFDLATALASSEKWDNDFWSDLMLAWSEMNLNEAECLQVFGRVSRTELYAKYAQNIADLLLKLLKNNDKLFSSNLLSQAHNLARALWLNLDRTKHAEESDDWLQLAINNSAGILAEFWLESLSIWRHQQDPMPNTFSEEYRTIFSEIVQDRTLPGRLGRCVLASQFAFLLAADEIWTKEKLLPFFDVENDVADFQAVWDGFLVYGTLNPAVAELLESLFLKAAQRIESSLAHRREQFIEYYTAMLGFYVAEPLNVFIPEFFRYANVETRHLFAVRVDYFLREMDETRQKEWWERWLKSYWENRLQGVPAVIESGEVGPMLGWLPHLSSVFPEAVNLATRMPKIPLEHTSLIYELQESELLGRHPEAVARLLVFMGDTNSSVYIWHGAREIIGRLLLSGLPSELETGLRELIAKLGLA